MKVSDVMNPQPHHIGLSATVREATEILHNSQASDLMVIGPGGTFIGVLSEGDLIRKALPQMDEIVAQGEGLAGGIELFVDKGRSLADQPIEPYVIKGALSVSPDAAVLKAAGIMVSKQIRRLPVVQDGKLVGTVARADICLGLMG